MFDATVRKLIDPPLNVLARYVARLGISANALTFVGFGLGLAVLIALTLHEYLWALGLILGNRLLDGLDGAVARRVGITDLGGYFDTVGDFIFFGSVVLGFALADPQANALAASFLLFSFMGTEASFLAYAALAEKHHFHTERYGAKSIYYLGGLVGATETLGVYVLACLTPDWFPVIATVFGVLCWVTIGTHAVDAWYTLGKGGKSLEEIEAEPNAEADNPSD